MYSMISLPLDCIITMKLKMQEILKEPVDAKVVVPADDELMLRISVKDKIIDLVFDVETVFYPVAKFNVRFRWHTVKNGRAEGEDYQTICSCEEFEDWSKESSFYDRIFEPIKKVIM